VAGKLFDFQDIYRIILKKADVIDRPFDVNFYLQTLYLMCAKYSPMLRRNREEILKGTPFARGLRAFLFQMTNDCIALLLDGLKLLPEEQMMIILRWLLDFIVSQLDIPMPEPPFRVPVVPLLGPVAPLI